MNIILLFKLAAFEAKQIYTPNYIDLLLGGFFGYITGKFGDTILGKLKGVDTSIKLKKRLKKVNTKQFNNILALDHAELSYIPTDIQIRLTKISLFFSPSLEFQDKLFNLFGASYFKRKDYGLKDFDFSKINNFKHILDVNKKLISLQFADSINKVYPIFNGQKLGVYHIQIKRIPDTDRAQLIIDLFKTDYFTHKVSRSIYRWLNSSTGFSNQIDLNFFYNNFNEYKCLNTSFGIYIIVQVNEGLVFCKRSAIVSNTEEAGKWHVSVDEGLDVQDLNKDSVDILQFAERGLLEELGLTRSVLDKFKDGKIKFLDIFLEKKRYEIVISAYIKLNMSMNELLNFHRTAKDGDYETSDIICIENESSAINKFFEKNHVTDMAKYCVERIVARGYF
ncbi:hypothetical protein [Mucilaginibacter phyllosphaerae]|uniref:Nudix hydrolase domain-containing protein n=1 Tax=Mucilaginibacter phyllosphaerae TaxID=1812349 RepID=A0A4Y8ABD9_9SPHI|nr:hypothetical protein [Mucilaginibacter phyllosphaerae]MBB3969346.1 hypothetical protein [Mucilaginibacter phyllosphaerae]TEW65864.1 hypothetical protein E2R65_12060 [Mucilaginibacter phyllosphaerae]GGH07846.1 hypothetical protein GCM10007352_12760 [Mucilaginibacter phyllosphaerae]